MTPDAFIAKWKLWTGGERAGAQSHFLDLCDLLGEPKPDDPDAYCFERGAVKTSGRRGFADVWHRGRFGWEYKAKGANLDDALAQLQQYALALENPPLLVACDFERFLIVTNWTNTVSRRIALRLEDLVDPAKREVLRHVLADPDRLKPGVTREQVTSARAIELAALARDLRARGHHPERVAKVLVRLVFCMFAQAIDLLPNRMLARMLEEAARDPAESEALAEQLFRTMATGGRFGLERVRWFDGGLFDTGDGEPLALPLDAPQARAALAAAEQDWSEIEPAILGTLFVQGLDPKRMEDLVRSAGAKGFGSVTFRKRFEQYTDRDKIMKIIEPVILRPLAAEWEAAKARIGALLHPAEGRKPGPKAQAEADGLYKAHLDRLRAFRVLDPACGSGNFLFLALHTLKDLEWRAILDAGQLGLLPEVPQVDPRGMLGIDLNPFAVQIARASVWIGHLQWYRRQGLRIEGEPILRPLDTIEYRDALFEGDGEYFWPEADVIVGNPPFLGGKLLRAELGDATVERMFNIYGGRVPREADLVTYWIVKAGEQIRTRRASRAGLVTTNSIRGGANREALERARADLVIFDAWDDEEWTVDGAAVRVSLLSLALPDDPAAASPQLDAQAVEEVYPDLTARRGSIGLDLSQAKPLLENTGIAFMGDTKGGAFDISGDLAREWLKIKGNPNGRPNSDVIKPWINGLDITRRPRDMWIIDFGWSISQQQAMLYEIPFGYVRKHVWPERATNRRESYGRFWWQHVEPRQGMWLKLSGREKYLATARVARHRLFCRKSASIVPDSQVIVIINSEDEVFGVLHSKFHEIWSLRMGSSLEDRPRYTPTTTFETFPFPEGIVPSHSATDLAPDLRRRDIEEAARHLNDLREAWLNPPDLVRREPEVVPGYPDRTLPRDEAAARELKKRTLTNLYNARPAWLDAAHRELDAAVAAAYGWPADLPDDEVLRRLFELNQERAAAGR